jgi:hypothetical protein
MFDRANRREYISRMKIKTSIVWTFINQLIRGEQNARDLEILNRRADFLNAEAADVLAYQVQV